MPLIKCKGCGSQISDQAAACPSCGAPSRPAQKKPFKLGCGGAVIALIVVGYFASTVSDCSAEREKQAQAERQQAQRDAAAESQRKELDAFRRNPGPKIAKAQELFRQEKWSDVVRLLKPYLRSNNPDVLKIYNDALENKLSATVASLPATNVQANYESYKQLAELRPQNATYARKRDSYESKLDEQKAKELAEKLVFGDRPTKSAWDGSYREVEAYLKRVANDPDSIEMVGCTDVFKNDDGWLVGCQYRGNNAFGGKILTANWFRIQRGQVVEVYDHDRFKWP
jgi:hypothetical protein